MNQFRRPCVAARARRRATHGVEVAPLIRRRPSLVCLWPSGWRWPARVRCCVSGRAGGLREDDAACAVGQARELGLLEGW